MNEIEIYKTHDCKTELNEGFDGEMVWLNQYQLAELFQTDRTAILKHLQNIYVSKELDKKNNFCKICTN